MVKTIEKEEKVEKKHLPITLEQDILNVTDWQAWGRFPLYRRKNPIQSWSELIL
jgi:hypothetical protein